MRFFKRKVFHGLIICVKNGQKKNEIHKIPEEKYTKFIIRNDIDVSQASWLYVHEFGTPVFTAKMEDIVYFEVV